MIAEQITVTATPTSIKDLIETARSPATVGKKCVGISLRYDSDETAVVTISDAGSATGVVILDAATESLLSASFIQVDISRVLLVTDTGTVVVHVVIEQLLM